MRIYDEMTSAYREWEGKDAGYKSNWPDVAAIPKQRHDDFYAVDVDGETVLTCKLSSTAVKEARHYKSQGHDVEVRFVCLDESDFQQADTVRRKKHWEETIYKPTPARTVHFR